MKFISTQVRESGKFLPWIPESGALESGIQLKESGTLITIGIQNTSSTDKYWNPVPGIRNPQCGIQNPRQSWIPLHNAIYQNSNSRNWHKLNETLK